MVTLSIALPELPTIRQAVTVGGFLDEAALRTGRDYKAINAGISAAQVLRKIARFVRLGEASVTVETSRESLGPLARACRDAVAETYRDNPAVPLLLDIATAAVMAAGEAA